MPRSDSDPTQAPSDRVGPIEPVEDLQAFCRRVLERGDLESKLAPPLDASGRSLPDRPSGPMLDLERPARDPGLRMRGGAERLPRPGQLVDPAHRATCLARFAHHELMAVELFAWALLRWPDLPGPLRRGLVTALADEQRHCRLYLERLAEHGGDFERDDHSDYFWRHAAAIAASPHGARAFLAAMGLTLEQANLDFTLTYRDGFAAAGDAASAAVCQQVHDDEIGHVALAARWLGRIGEASSTTTHSPLDLYLECVPFPLGPARAKGRRFEVSPRRRAGLDATLIEHVRRARSSQERSRPGDGAGAAPIDPGASTTAELPEA
ncbi:MAG: DUF455 family protein [Spirochaetaceae bacterium]|nr:DUF455 family protein [Spirochaetaceae bacterium]